MNIQNTVWEQAALRRQPGEITEASDVRPRIGTRLTERTYSPSVALMTNDTFAFAHLAPLRTHQGNLDTCTVFSVKTNKQRIENHAA